MTAAKALYCQELKELMIESGRRFRVPEKVAKTVTEIDPSGPDTRFVKNFFVLHGIIPADCEVYVLDVAVH